jgi:exosortase/archaeosortase family protein
VGPGRDGHSLVGTGAAVRDRATATVVTGRVRRLRTWARTVVVMSTGFVLAGALIFAVRDIARGEAQINGWLVTVTGLATAHPVGSAVIFPLDGRWVGFVITAGCSAAVPLVAPLLVASGLVAVGRVNWLRAALTVAATTFLLIVVNQLRLSIIVASMRAWGYETGYQRSHILIGSAVTTLGLGLVTVLFIVFLASGRRPSSVRHV